MKLSKVLSLMLAICMLFTMTSFAAINFTDVEETATYAESVQVLTALNIINGYVEDGVSSFKPEGKITRAEFSAIVTRMLGMGEIGGNKQSTGFSDVDYDHWASGYISAARNAGIIDGMGDGTFQPESEVTYEQAVKMLVASIGYTPKAQSLGGYPTGYTLVGNQEGVTAGTAFQTGGAARSTVARLVYNTLTAPNMEQRVYGGINGPEYARDEGVSILYTKFGIVKTEAIIKDIPLDKNSRNVTLKYTSVDKVAAYNGWAYTNQPNKPSGAVELYPTVLKGDNNLNGLQGLIVTALIDTSDDSETKLVTVVPRSTRNVFVDVDPQLLEKKDDNGWVRYYRNISDDKPVSLQLNKTSGVIDVNAYVNLSSGVYSTAVLDASSSDKKTKAMHSNYRYVDTDNDGDYDTVFVTSIGSFVAGNVNTTSNKVFKAMDMSNVDSSFGEASLLLDPEDEQLDWVITNSTGAVLDITDIKYGQVVNVKESLDNSGSKFYDIVISESTITGTVSEAYEEYNKLSGDYEQYFSVGGQSYQLFSSNLSALKPGDDIEAIVASNGKIIGYTIEASMRSYGLITAANIASDFGKTYQVQMLKDDGTMATLNLMEKFNARSTVFGTGATDDADFTAGFKPGTLIIYETNSKNEIKKVASSTSTAASKFFGISLKDFDLDFKGGAVSGTYRLSTDKLGNYYIGDKSAVFTTSVAESAVKKNDVMLSSKSILNEDDTYTGYVIADANSEAKAIVLFEASNAIKWDSYPIIITKTSTIQIDGDSRVKYTGFVQGDEIEITEAEDEEFGLSTKDVALFALNGAGEMVGARKLAGLNGNNYIFATNTYPGATKEVDQDNDNVTKVAPIGFTVNARATTGFDKLTQSIAKMSSLDSTFATTDMLGYAVVGKAYQVRGRALQMLIGNDYAATQNTTTAGAKGYDIIDADPAKNITDGLISDVTVNTAVPAYIYNGRTNNIKVTSLADLETEKLTEDDKIANQFDNDDAVYVYKYDGDTYFVLIVDAAGDN